MNLDSFSYNPRESPHGDDETSKTAGVQPFGVQNRPEEIRYDEGEQSSRPNTPSMTNGSSRSNSSSVITCETCSNPGNHCTCSDLGGFQVVNGEEWTRSPRSSPALFARRAKGKLSSRGSRVPQFGHRLPYPKPAEKTSAYSFPGTDQNLSLDSETSARLKIVSSSDRQCLTSHPPNDTVAQSAADTPPSRNNMECLTSDSEAEEEDEDSDDDDEGDEDNDWSGQDSNLEAVILKAVGDDLRLAADLIPILHRSLRSEFATSATEKLGSWRYGVIKSAHGNRDDEQASTNHPAENTTSPRKRQRHESSSKGPSKRLGDFDDEEEEENDDPQDSKGREDDTGTEEPLPRLACPFYKRDPRKYSIQHEDVEGPRKAQYRACEGPGFKNMPRLKEHLKRKHYPVQCDRCYRSFPGPDRAACILELQDHRQLVVPCERRPDSGREGISDAQWESLDKKKSAKNSRGSSRIALWMEYWAILFPGIEQPGTPWYDNKFPNRILQRTSEEARRFAELFRPMLNLKTSQQYICFLEGQEDTMKRRVEALAHQAFSIYLGLNGSPSATNSSSSGSFNQSSSLGRLSHNLSTPKTSRGQISSSGSRSRKASNQTYSMDVANSTTPISMAAGSISQGHPTTMGPPLMAISRMSTQNFGAKTMQSPMPSEQPTQRPFSSTIESNFNGFELAPDPFVSGDLGAGDAQWGEPMDFNSSDATFYGNRPTPSLTAAGYYDISGSPLQALGDIAEDNTRNLADLRGFDQYHDNRNLRYGRAQQ